MDLILSSGFLGFSRHVGFLQAVEDLSLEVEAVCGTSSGAMVGALWAAGMPADEIGVLLSERAPARFLRASRRPWTGMFSMAAVTELLVGALPPSFEALRVPLAVGVCQRRGGHLLLRSGPLPEAVTASCSIPYLFTPVAVGPEMFLDGGAADRLGYEAWQAWRPGKQAAIHWIDRSRGKDPGVPPSQHAIVRSQRSGATFFSLGKFWEQAEETRRVARRRLEDAATQTRESAYRATAP